MRIKNLILFAVIASIILVFFNLNTLSQQSRDIPQSDYEVEVIVTNVEVVVTDKKGNRVTGLKPENFEVYEDGLLQKLTNFYEVKGLDVYTSVLDKETRKLQMSAKPLPRKSSRFKNKIIFYFDNWQLHPLNRNRSIKKLESFIRNNYSGDNNSNQGMVVCLGQKLEIITEFTSDPWKLIQAINQVKGYSGQALLQARLKDDLRKELNRMVKDMSPLEDKFDTYNRAIGFARNYVEAEQNDLIHSLKSLNAFVNYLVGIEGRKILIYVSDGLPINPGEEVYSFLDQAFPQGNARSEVINYDATRFFKELTARCNAYGIALYPINARGLESRIFSADKDAGWNIYGRGSGMVRPGTKSTNDSLKLMARETGGLAVINLNDIEPALEKIKNDLRFYYSLGYVSPHREDDRYHSIRVNLVGTEEQYNVRVRRGYVSVSPEEKIKEAVFSRLFLQRQYNPMNLVVKTMPVNKMPVTGKLNLTLKVLIPIKKLTLIPQDEEYLGKIKLYIALMDSSGQVSPCHELTHQIKIPENDYQTAIRMNYPYLAEMYVEAGRYTISLALKDVLSETVNYIQLEREIR